MRELCHICKGLDLSNVNNRKPQVYPLGLWKDVRERSSECPLCYLVIRSSPGRRVWDRQATVEWKQDGGFFTNSLTEYIAFIDDGTATSPLGFASEIKAELDPALIKKWLNLCEQNHRDTCVPKRGPLVGSDNPSGLKVFRLIDVIDNCIVKAAPGMRYVALSYVSGEKFTPLVTLRRENYDMLTSKGALLQLQDKLATTFKDAITLVKNIRERYLWIDSFCLVQDNPQDILYAVGGMDMVYECSLFTLVAASGVDANAGLPGVNSHSLAVPRTHNQLKIEVLPGIKMTINKGVYDGFMGSAYRKRGWTYVL